jgi:hypothetical protein
MDAVRCKFKVESREDVKDGANITLRAVTNGSPENEKFYQYTPGGHFQLSIVKPETADFFRIGEEYYIDISKVANIAREEAPAETNEEKEQE